MSAPWPHAPLLDEIAAVAGLDAALAIVEAFGGRELFVPGRAPDNHPLVEAVGREAAEKLCQHFRSRDGGVRLRIPKGPKSIYPALRATGEAMLSEGRSNDHIARALNLHLRTVERWRKRARDKGLVP